MRTKKILACIIASLIVFLSLTPTYANAASSSEIRNQINELKKEKEAIQEKIAEVRESFVCQRCEPEGDSGMAGTQRYFHHIQHLHPSEFRFQGCICQRNSRNLPGLRKGVPSDCPPDF